MTLVATFFLRTYRTRGRRSKSSSQRLEKGGPILTEPGIEIWLEPPIGIAADSEGAGRLSQFQITQIQTTVTSLISGFAPDVPERPSGAIALDEVELELSFKVTADAGGVLRILLVGGKAEATIRARAVWKKQGSPQRHA